MYLEKVLMEREKDMTEKLIGITFEIRSKMFFFLFGLLKCTHLDTLNEMNILVSKWPFLEKYSLLSVIGLVFFFWIFFNLFLC